MATNYTVNLTDQIRSFQIAPYTTNGPNNPLSSSPDAKASTADTTLLLYGKGTPEYGERTAENLINLLENFSSPTEPVSPISGQLWLNRAVTPHQLKTYNMERHVIAPDPEGGGVDWFAIAYNNTTDRDDILTRMDTSNINFRVRIHRGAVEQEEYIISTAAALSTIDSNFIRFQVTPTPPATRSNGLWHYGDWDWMIQGGAPLHEDLNANAWGILNLRDPSTDQDATTKKYVDDEIIAAIAASNELGELSDVTITAPVIDNILVYDGAGNWINSTGTSVFLSITGGTLTGDISLSGSNIHDIGTPAHDFDAANKKYVDDQIIAVGTPNNLTDLGDVTLTAPTSSEMLIYNGSFWVNSSPATFIADNSILTTAGTQTLTAPFNVALGYSFIDTDFVNKDYVDSAITAGAGDIYVDGGSYDNGTKILTLTRTEGQSDIDIIIASAGGIDSTSLTHEISDPNDPLLIPENTPSLLYEQEFYTSGNYPTLFGDEIFRLLNTSLGRLSQPKGRLVFETNGLDTVNLGPGSVTNQSNSVMVGGAGSFSVGTHTLSVYVNGIKQVASESGFREITALLDFGIFQGTHTGLSSGTIYEFTVAVNGQAPITVGIDGLLASRAGNLVDAINALADSNYHDAGSPNTQWAFGATLFDGGMVIVSSLPGAGSSIDLVDGSTNPLFASMIGNGLTTGAFTIELPLSNGVINEFPPVSYSYDEIGRAGRLSQLFQFVGATIPPAGSTVEVITEQSLHADEL